MGDENDTVFCEMVRPNLTSIEVEPFGIGYKAAEELDRMLRGGQPMPEPYLSVPQFVVNRASTDILMARDELVQKALRLIRQEVVRGLSAKELVRRLGVSRTKLENRFRSELHRTVHEVIIDRRMAEASSMLLETAQTQSAIAAQCGFVDNSHFSRLFHKRFGLTPGKYRLRHVRANR